VCVRNLCTRLGVALSLSLSSSILNCISLLHIPSSLSLSLLAL
jgi:hypothetical protein